MNRICFRPVRNTAKHQPSSSAEHPISELPWLQVSSHACLNELETIMRAAADLDDNDH
jgi:hypothetical protein